jgi:hypothetical protein
MKIAIKILFFGIIVLFALNVSGQDYVITVKGDSIPCKVRVSLLLQGDIRYKSEAMSSFERIKPTEIKEFYVASKNELHHSVFTDSKSEPEFKHVIEKGKLSLFEQTTYSWGSTMNSYSGTMNSMMYSSRALYVGKSSDYVIELSKKQSRDKFAEMLKDNKDVYDKFINEDKFSFEQIKKIIHLYNQNWSWGQDYLIMKSGQTVFCEIETSTFNNVGRYRTNSKEKFIKIDTAITGYFSAKDSSTFLLKTLPKKNHREFVKLLVKGRINLYSYSLNKTNEDRETALYAEKESDGLVQIKHAFSSPEKNEEKACLDMISDNPNLFEKLKNLAYNFTSVVNYIKLYNSEYSDKSKPAK